MKTMTLPESARLIPLVLLAVVLTGCEMGPWHMMDGGAFPASYSSNGERIYFTGTSASGDPVSHTGGNMHMRMMGGSCATCHGSDRQGRRMMPEFWKMAPPLTRNALFESHDDGDAHGAHDRYTDGTLQRAVFQGADPAGNFLDDNMPRWSMTDRDWKDLLAYLRS